MNTNNVIIKLCVLAMVVVGLPLSFAGIDPAAQAIFDKYAKAVGGSEAYEKIDTASFKMVVSMPAMGMELDSFVKFKSPNKFYMEMTMPGMGVMKQGYDGTEGWAEDPIQGSRPLSPEELKELERNADIKKSADLASQYDSAVLLPDLSPEGYSVVEAGVEGEAQKDKLYFDGSTGLMARMDTVEDAGPQGKMPITINFTEHAQFGEIIVATKANMSMMGMQMNLSISDYVLNEDIPDSLFSKSE